MVPVCESAPCFWLYSQSHISIRDIIKSRNVDVQDYTHVYSYVCLHKSAHQTESVCFALIILWCDSNVQEQNPRPLKLIFRRQGVVQTKQSNRRWQEVRGQRWFLTCNNSRGPPPPPRGSRVEVTNSLNGHRSSECCLKTLERVLSFLFPCLFPPLWDISYTTTHSVCVLTHFTH